MNEIALIEQANLPPDPDALLARAQAVIALVKKSIDPRKVRQGERVLESIEHVMFQAGLFKPEQIRIANEGKVRARWKLGQLLAKVERGKHPGRGKVISTGLKSLLADLNMTAQIAMLTQRLGTLPRDELEKELTAYRRADVFISYDVLIERARPYWYKEQRRRRHQQIRAAAEQTDAVIGPFPLLYVDPPTQFEVRSEKGMERSADRHYQTLSDEEIIGFLIDGETVDEIAAENAALFLWGTSSNMFRTKAIMDAWGFEFKASAIWDKGVIGTGYVFRNQHEVLLYGTRGDMPAPQYQPPSVFRYPRGEHSAKPPEIRAEIEKMYPDFDANTRLELFARGKVPGWTTYGFEADK